MNFGRLSATLAPTPGTLWLLFGAFFVILLAAATAAILLARRLYRHNTRAGGDVGNPMPRSDNPTAFMTASMQAVIQKLKEQEKELETLHRAELAAPRGEHE